MYYVTGKIENLLKTVKLDIGLAYAFREFKNQWFDINLCKTTYWLKFRLDLNLEELMIFIY